MTVSCYMLTPLEHLDGVPANSKLPSANCARETRAYYRKVRHLCYAFTLVFGR